MHLIFLDSSGNTGQDLAHPTSSTYFLLALCIPGDHARRLEDQVTQILRQSFGTTCEQPGWECKGSDLYRGEGPCGGMPPADRIALYESLLRLVREHNVRIVWQGIDKPRLAVRYVKPLHPHKLAFVYLVEQVERHLRDSQEFGLLVSDEEKEVEQQVIEDLTRYKQIGTSFGHAPIDLTRIVDNVHWVKSHHSRLLQLCDCCVYLCQRQWRDREKASHSAREIQRLWGIVQPQVIRGRIWPT